jgi:hypothetical protein
MWDGEDLVDINRRSNDRDDTFEGWAVRLQHFSILGGRFYATWLELRRNDNEDWLVRYTGFQVLNVYSARSWTAPNYVGEQWQGTQTAPVRLRPVSQWEDLTGLSV